MSYEINYELHSLRGCPVGIFPYMAIVLNCKGLEGMNVFIDHVIEGEENMKYHSHTVKLKKIEVFVQCCLFKILQM